VLYPVALTGVGKIAFADKAEGSLIRKDGKLLVPSDRTSFQLATVFLGRPSATGLCQTTRLLPAAVMQFC
jgi:K+-transporting ATPase ATPase C chain